MAYKTLVLQVEEEDGHPDLGLPDETTSWVKEGNIFHVYLPDGERAHLMRLGSYEGETVWECLASENFASHINNLGQKQRTMLEVFQNDEDMRDSLKSQGVDTFRDDHGFEYAMKPKMCLAGHSLLGHAVAGKRVVMDSGSFVEIVDE